MTRSAQFLSGAALVLGAIACAHKQQTPGASDNSRIKPSSTTSARDTAAEYGNQRTRMGSPSDSSRRDSTMRRTSEATSTTTPSSTTTQNTASGSTGGTAGQNDPSIIGSPAWWRTHRTADGKPLP
jgi:hypothetical protein